jgi:hypothetical protein
VRLEAFTPVTMKNAVLLDVTSMVLVRTDVSEERIASIIRATRIGELELATEARCVTSQKSTFFEGRNSVQLCGLD